MQLVNWDGALIGPGSEWLWSAAQFVVVVVSLAGIYRQLRAQGAANALQRMESLHAQWDSDWLRYTRLALAVALKENEINNQTMVKARPLLNVISNLDDLRKAGYISIKEIDDNYGYAIPRWLAALTPLLERERVVHGDPTIYDLHELLAALQQVEAKRGLRRIYDSSTAQKYLHFVIEATTDEIHLENEWKSGVLPEPKSHAARSDAAAEVG